MQDNSISALLSIYWEGYFYAQKIDKEVLN